MRSMRGVVLGLLAVLLCEAVVEAAPPAVDAATTAPMADYKLQPGDILEVSVWKESELQKEVAIRPDGGFTFPLAGEIDARGKSVENVRLVLTERLAKFLPSP